MHNTIWHYSRGEIPSFMDNVFFTCRISKSKWLENTFFTEFNLAPHFSNNLSLQCIPSWDKKLSRGARNTYIPGRNILPSGLRKFAQFHVAVSPAQSSSIHKMPCFWRGKSFCLLIFLFLHHIQIALFYICILLGQITTPKTISTILKIVSDSIY